MLDGVLPLVAEGLDVGQPVLVAFPAPHQDLVRDALDPAATRQVVFADMAELSQNPTLAVDALRAFTDSHSDGPVRVVGEVIWPGRSAAEIAEAQLTEALLNVTVEPDRPAWVTCCYDTSGLPDEVIERAERSHPALVRDGSYRGSASYGGRSEAVDLFAAPLPEPPPGARAWPIDRHQVDSLMQRVAEAAADWGAPVPVRDQLRSALRHLLDVGLGEQLRLWNDGRALVCQLDDRRRIHDPSTGHRGVEPEGSTGSALAAVHRLVDLVQVRSNLSGTSVRLCLALDRPLTDLRP